MNADEAEREVERRWPGVSCEADHNGEWYSVVVVPLAAEKPIEIAEPAIGTSPIGYRDAIANLALSGVPWLPRSSGNRS